MTKNEFLTSFQNELQKRHIPDWEDVVSEYEQHFALKQARRLQRGGDRREAGRTRGTGGAV